MSRIEQSVGRVRCATQRAAAHNIMIVNIIDAVNGRFCVAPFTIINATASVIIAMRAENIL